MIDHIRFLFRIFKFMRSPTYAAARKAMLRVAGDRRIQILGNKEGMTSYCPRCGQSPQRDVRHDEAFEMAYGFLDAPDRKHDLHFAIELSYWLRCD